MQRKLPPSAIRFKGEYYSYYDENRVWRLDKVKGWTLEEPPEEFTLGDDGLVVACDECICTDEKIWEEGCQCGGS